MIYGCLWYNGVYKLFFLLGGTILHIGLYMVDITIVFMLKTGGHHPVGPSNISWPHSLHKLGPLYLLYTMENKYKVVPPKLCLLVYNPH